MYLGHRRAAASVLIRGVLTSTWGVQSPATSPTVASGSMSLGMRRWLSPLLSLLSAEQPFGISLTPVKINLSQRPRDGPCGVASPHKTKPASGRPHRVSGTPGYLEGRRSPRSAVQKAAATQSQGIFCSRSWTSGVRLWVFRVTIHVTRCDRELTILLTPIRPSPTGGIAAGDTTR